MDGALALAEKQCHGCGISKPLAAYAKNPNAPSGLQYVCRECFAKYYMVNKQRVNEQQRRWYARNRRDVSERHARRKQQFPERHIHQHVKAEAKRHGILFSIAVEDIVIPRICPILGIPLAMSHRGSGMRGSGPRSNSPSLDRIIPELGYVPGNVQVISNRANSMKNCGSLEEMILLGEWARRRLEGAVH